MEKKVERHEEGSEEFCHDHQPFSRSNRVEPHLGERCITDVRLMETNLQKNMHLLSSSAPSCLACVRACVRAVSTAATPPLASSAAWHNCTCRQFGSRRGSHHADPPNK